MQSIQIIRWAACVAVALAVMSGSAAAQFHGHPKDGADYPKLNYDSLFDAATPLENSSDGKALLASVIDASGGREHLETLKGYRATWALTSAVYSEASNIIKSVATGRHHRIHLERSDHYQTRILSGRQAWFANPDTVIALNHMRYKAEIFSNLVLNLPLSIENEPYASRRYGTRTDDPLQYLYLEKADSLLLVVGVDPADYTIRVVEGVVKEGQHSMTFVNKLSDYKKVRGYLFPHSLTNISMGLKVGEAVISEIEVNPEFPASEFRPAGTN